MNHGHFISPLPLCGILNSVLFTGIGKNHGKQNLSSLRRLKLSFVEEKNSKTDRSLSASILCYSYSCLTFFFFFRLAASYLFRACVLVFNSILWIESKSGRNLPCITAFPDCRWLYRSIKFRTILSRSAFQCKQKCYSGNDKATHR